MSILKIALDAGHGLHTPGRRCMAEFDPDQTREWTLNARIMDKLQAALNGYDCVTMRVDDVTGEDDVSLRARVAKANAWDADLYISMHHNAGIKGGSGGGTVVYHDCTSQRGTALASTLYQYIVGATGLRGNRSRTVIKKAYYVLANTKMRAYLVENGFMDSSVDTPIIITEEHANKTAAGIVQWLKDEYSLKPKHIHTTEEKKEPLTPATDPADLTVGAEVIVDGYIYGNGIGKGRSILKKGEHMFVTDYAGKGYPYCWGVAKKAGGRRQGWACARDLSVVLGHNENLVDGSSVEYFKMCKYRGSSITAALKSIGENSGYSYRKTIAEANDIKDYRGTAAQNVQMVTLLRDGKLIKP